jgi:hypothetical protein
MGEQHRGISVGPEFSDLHDEYICPVCGATGNGKVGNWAIISMEGAFGILDVENAFFGITHQYKKIGKIPYLYLNSSTNY